jgi:3-oxoisoapionate kinase
MTDQLMLTFYGDDFTGSTDAMESLVLGGVPCVLFLTPPTPEFVRERFPDAHAIGVAGVSRSLSPAQMNTELPPQFEALKALGAPLFHYKICSTFDSSPKIGSLGAAIEIGQRIFGTRTVPLMVGAPALKRYVTFGNLYAAFGGDTYRIDRHPTMSKHPITPMHEADLRLHLAAQTESRIGSIDLLALQLELSPLLEHYRQQAHQFDVLLFDTVDEADLLKIGQLLATLQRDAPLFAVGSSGIEYALTACWQRDGVIETPPALPSPGPVDQLLVMSGSAAPQTSAQITWALENGFHGIRLDSAGLTDPQYAGSVSQSAVAEAEIALRAGKNVILYSAIGPADPSIEETRTRMTALDLDPATIGTLLGAQQGQIVRTLLDRIGLRRVCVVGGDTCGHAARQLDIYALEIVIPIAPGSPLCRAHSTNPTFDGLEISLKSGQVGKPDYFGSILRGAV